MIFVVGVDGGRTSVRAVILDEGAQELGRGATGAVVIPDDPRAAIEGVSRAVGAAAEVARVSLPAAALWVGLAGAGDEAARRAAQDALARAGLADRVHVGTDVEAAFHAAFGEGPGILLIAGTGSIAWARNEEGEVRRVGGWGERLGDEGSGYAIGVAALKAVAHAEDGRGPATTMRDAVKRHLGLAGPREVAAWAEAAPKGDVAALVPIVADAAHEGDPVATKILARAVTDLEAHVDAIVAGWGPGAGRPLLAMGGGLLGHGGPLRDALAEALRERPVSLLGDPLDPPMGAAKLALELPPG